MLGWPLRELTAGATPRSLSADDGHYAHTMLPGQFLTTTAPPLTAASPAVLANTLKPTHFQGASSGSNK